MPIGLSPTTGIIAYTGIKILGYSLAGRKLNHWYAADRPFPLIFGIARTLLGVAVGMGSLYLLQMIHFDQLTLFLWCLIPLRFFEWWLILYLFYEKKDFSLKRISKYSLMGIGWSFLLDIPVIASILILPGGYWVC